MKKNNDEILTLAIESSCDDSCAALVREDPGESCKVSLRSSGTDNVQAVAIQFGGGGHFNAAGATIHEPIETAVKQILEAIQKITFSTTDVD